MQKRYIHHNHRKYNLKVHIVMVTKYRKRLIMGEIKDTLKQECIRIAGIHNWNIVAMETDEDHIHLLLEYDTIERICDLVKILKQETTFILWQKYPLLMSQNYWKKKIFWSDGYFACSIGEVSSATIQKYIESQG